jgi:hypothetical protein
MLCVIDFWLFGVCGLSLMNNFTRSIGYNMIRFCGSVRFDFVCIVVFTSILISHRTYLLQYFDSSVSGVFAILLVVQVTQLPCGKHKGEFDVTLPSLIVA